MEKVEEVPSTYLTPSPRVLSGPPYSVLKPRASAVPLKLVLPKKGSDDEYDAPLMIDERMPKKPAKIGQNQQRGPIKLRLSGITKIILKLVIN